MKKKLAVLIFMFLGASSMASNMDWCAPFTINWSCWYCEFYDDEGNLQSNAYYCGEVF